MKRILLSSMVIGALALAVLSFTPAKVDVSPIGDRMEVLANAPGKWTVDKAHSNVKFSVTHLVVSDVDGSFKMFDGSMEHTKADYSDAKINFTVDVNSISTDNDMRDKHLKGDDFFNAEQFPTIKFVSTSFTPAGGISISWLATLPFAM